jgi:predicted NAD/FAD-dependent oxidoreductase
VRTLAFQHWSQKWLAEGLIEPWSTGWSDASLAEVTPATHPRFIAKGGMMSLAEHLAQGMEVRTEVRLEAVKQTTDGWQVRAAGGQQYHSRALLLTAPVPESLGLLAAGQTHLTSHDQAWLQQISYEPSLVALFRLEGGTKLPGLGALHLPNAPIRFLIDNQRKGISPQATIITAQADAEYSRRLWDWPDSDVLEDIRLQIQTYLQPDSAILEEHLHRWRYALPASLHPEPCLVAADLPPLVFAGDAFGSLRGIEGAALSGLAAGEALDQLL